MLLNLYVKNMALIEEADISFKEGLNILTGETGAGKSIVIGSINIALGKKVSADIIRHGAEYALVELTFSIDNQDKLEELKKMEIEELDCGELIISRKITPTRSIIKVNGQTMTASELKNIAGIIIDIHGQLENQTLLNEAKHLQLIDKFADTSIIKVKEELSQLHSQYIEALNKLNSMNVDESQRMKEISFMEFEINEISNSQLKIGEDIELEQQYKKMKYSQKILEEMSVIDNVIGNSSYDNAANMISKAVRSINTVYEYDNDNLNSIHQQLNDIENLINDVSHDVSNYISDMQFSPAEFNEIEQRLDLINNLKSKYGNTIEDIFEYQKDIQARLDTYQNFEELKLELTAKVDILNNEMLKKAKELSLLRHTSACSLSENIKKSLIELNFLDVRFETEFEESNCTANGYDIARFMISTNPGEDIKPLSKIASGGEMSRIMLAVKTVLAKKDDIETLIFDEIDAGISGRTAQLVANKLNEVSHTHQIICITHLPQIASMADVHFVISKSVKEDITYTQIIPLDETKCIDELARLLGGAQITETVINNAKEMRKLALKQK